TFSTVVRNRAQNSFVGGIYSNASSVIVRNSILAQNSDNGTAPDVRAGVSVMLFFSLLGNNTGSGLAASPRDANGHRIGTAASPTDPRLGPLQNSGGAPLPHAPPAGSPAVDNGGPVKGGPATDQAGQVRVYDLPGVANVPGGNGSDLGAFEVQPGLTWPTP